MRSGKTRQRRRWTNGYGKADISIELPTSLLNKFEYDVSRYGHNWFTMPLVTGANSGIAAEPHTVRIVGDVTKGDLFGETIKISFPIEFVQTSRTEFSTPVDGAGSATKLLAFATFSGSLSQTNFPLSIRAVETYPGAGVSKEYFMPLATSKTLVGNFTGGASQSLSEDSKTLAGQIVAGSSLSQETHRDILNGSGEPHLDPLEASVKSASALILSGTLQNYVNTDTGIHSVPSGGNYIGTDDTQTLTGVLSSGVLLNTDVTISFASDGGNYTGTDDTKTTAGLILSGGVLLNTDQTISYASDGGNYTGTDDTQTNAGTLLSGGVLLNTDVTISFASDGGNYTGTDDTKTTAGLVNSGTLSAPPSSVSCVIDSSNKGGYYTDQNDSSTQTWSGAFNGGLYSNTDVTISSISDGGNYMGTSDTQTWSGAFNGGSYANTDTTISANPDGGNYIGAEGTQTWASNFNGGQLLAPGTSG